MWQSKVVDVVFQQDLQMVLEKDKLVEMMEVKWQKINHLACEMIMFCLAKVKKYFVIREIVTSDLWPKLKDIYMIKST